MRSDLGDVQAEVQVAQAPSFAELDLLEYRKGADAELLEAGIVVAIYGRERFIAAVDERDTDQLTVEQIAELERLTAADDQKLTVAFEIDAIAIAG